MKLSKEEMLKIIKNAAPSCGSGIVCPNCCYAGTIECRIQNDDELDEVLQWIFDQYLEQTHEILHG